MFHTYLTAAYLYVVLRFILPLPLSWPTRAGIGVALLLVSKYHYFSQLVFGDMWSPELPYLVVLAMGWAFCAFVLLTVFVLLTDVAGMLHILAVRRTWNRTHRLRARGGAAIAAAVFAALGVANAVAVPGVHRVELAVPGLPFEFEGFRLVQLSDLHISRLLPRAWAQAVVDRTNELKPDLVVITGDLIDGSVENRRDDVAPLSSLRAVNGVLGITGNHEYYFDYSEWRPVLSGLGIRMLDNEHVAIRRGEATLTVAGITDAVAGDYRHEKPDREKALRGTSSESPVLLLSHRPNGAADNARAGVAVQLSGHTHGGMIRGLDLIAKPANDGFVSRGYLVDGIQLYVSNGTGLWLGFPIRLGVPSEITEFTLRAKSKDGARQ